MYVDATTTTSSSRMLKTDVYLCLVITINLRGEMFMAFTFYYKNIPYIQIDTITIIGEFNNYDELATPLTYEKGGWYVELDLPRGKHPYKYIINGVLRFNDPNATFYALAEDGEVWSITQVGDNRELIANQHLGTIQLTSHVLTNKKMDFKEEARYKNSFNLNIAAAVVACFEFNNINGIHTISAIWMNPQYHMHHISDHYIDVKEDDENNAADIWFWIDLQERDRIYPLGTWYIKLFVDGEFLIEDRFTLGKGGTYQATNKGILVNQGFE